MARQPHLSPLAAFERDGTLPPYEPARFSSNPALDECFIKAVYDGDLRLVKRAVRAVGRGAEGRRLAEKLGAVRDGFGNGLLHSAVLGGSLPMCRYLVEDLRMDVDDVGLMGETPFTVAVARGNMELVSYFLDQGADKERLNDDGYTPLHLATGKGVEMVELLLSKGANPNSLNHGGTALHLAAIHGQDDIMKVLLDHHADHKLALSGTDHTALVLATVSCSLKCVKLLLEAGADVDGIGKDTPLMIAAIDGSTDILKCLVLAGADANVTDTYGRTPLEIVARSGRREHVEILFPVSTRLRNVRDWSVDGVIRHVKSVRPAKKTMLASAKSRAHQAFKSGNYLIAVKIYDEAMKLNPGDATLLSNKSLCWLRFGYGKEALEDAQACRRMRPGWAKACYREGCALMLLKDYEKACGAFLEGVKLEAGNTEIEEGLREALASLKITGGITGKDMLDQRRLVDAVN
ncbi:hypothetical protein QYE76_065615 [Lolium multiflorum]|uniref:Uncharacterized protein n=1 Tax=Lolium multiflorum TaxID=4521 RepID=A0AAD8WA51_LOLMU|nr:hypothetical protein QYE76_065615 [Lolium multiflorum]